MKKVLIFLPALAAAVLSCSDENVKYNIKGCNASEEGALVYLVDQISHENLDSTVVSDGCFQMKGKAPKDAFLSVNISGSNWNYLLFNDGEPVQVNVADSTVSGSALNNKLTECDRRNEAAYAAYRNFINAFNELPEAEQEARIEEFIPQYRAKLKEYTDFYMGMIEENMDNLVPVAFIQQVGSLAGEEKLNELLASDAPFAQHPYVLNMKQKMEESAAKRQKAEERKQAIIGQKFLDLEEADTNGNPHKLSEYVGQGNWVLVDFWASWCGPCKSEMPNVVAAYKKYHGKGFQIVGLSFDREKEPWVKAITEWEMPWIHLSDLKYWNSLASDVYSVNSIPDNLLIDPDGTVVARCLRGEALEAKLAEIFQ